MPERSGFPSGAFGVGASRFGFPSAARGTLGVGYEGHCAPSDAERLAKTETAATTNRHRVSAVG